MYTHARSVPQPEGAAAAIEIFTKEGIIMRKSNRIKAAIAGSIFAVSALAAPLAMFGNEPVSIAENASVTASAAVNANYARLLQYSLYFYDANMCGKKVDDTSLLTWRGNCHTSDEVDGGFHDAGDHAMFGLPQLLLSVGHTTSSRTLMTLQETLLTSRQFQITSTHSSRLLHSLAEILFQSSSIRRAMAMLTTLTGDLRRSRATPVSSTGQKTVQVTSPQHMQQHSP